MAQQRKRPASARGSAQAPPAAPLFDPELLAILRCPKALASGADRDHCGRLERVRGCWLVSADSGLKYPIIDGIPVLLIEEGERWANTPIDALPVPPPPLLDSTSAEP